MFASELVILLLYFSHLTGNTDSDFTLGSGCCLAHGKVMIQGGTRSRRRKASGTGRETSPKKQRARATAGFARC